MSGSVACTVYGGAAKIDAWIIACKMQNVWLVPEGWECERNSLSTVVRGWLHDHEEAPFEQCMVIATKMGLRIRDWGEDD